MSLTPQGFRRKTFQQIQQEFIAELEAKFGKIDSNPNEPFGQLVNIYSNQKMKLEELAEAVYLAIDPDFAEGTQQDSSYALVGVRRLNQTKTRVRAVCFGDEGTVIDSTRQAEVSSTGALFRSVGTFTITGTNAIRVFIEVETVEENDYIITVNGTPYTYSASDLDTETDILEGLEAELGAENAITVEIIDEQLVLTSATIIDPFTVAVNSRLSIDSVGSQGFFDALNPGAIFVPTNSLDTINTPVSGWTSVTNLLQGDTGRGVENDTDFRVRRDNSLRISGGGTFDAVRARLRQEVANVTGVFIIQNKSDIVDGEGRPPHSYEVVISGGDEQEIAEKIWELGPLGIQTVGNIERTIVDSQGDNQIVKFSRATQIFVWIRITLTLYSEEPFPTGGTEAVREDVFNRAVLLNPGEDVLPQRLKSVIFNTQGIQSAVLELATSATPESSPGAYSDDPAGIPIASNEQAVFAIDRINVTVAP
jgi:uncharacterized phage protein gp47/JayE